MASIHIKVVALSSTLLLIGAGAYRALAEDAVTVAPNHYKVEFENEKVRVIRITYAPGEESSTHDHKNGVVVNLGDYSVQFTEADGTTRPVETSAAGTFQWSPADTHAAKNVGNTRAEALYIELKD
jgi:predicted metal-dependent enzyme (double-stranded beta helix superfamily)